MVPLIDQSQMFTVCKKDVDWSFDSIRYHHYCYVSLKSNYCCPYYQKKFENIKFMGKYLTFFSIDILWKHFLVNFFDKEHIICFKSYTYMSLKTFIFTYYNVRFCSGGLHGMEQQQSSLEMSYLPERIQPETSCESSCTIQAFPKRSSTVLFVL